MQTPRPLSLLDKVRRVLPIAVYFVDFLVAPHEKMLRKCATILSLLVSLMLNLYIEQSERMALPFLSLKDSATQ